MNVGRSAEQLWGRAKMGALGEWRRAGETGRDKVCAIDC